jgi:hypothetical protein
MTYLSWHQQRAAGMHALPYDVVGYTNEGAILCPACAERVGIEETPILRDQADGTEVCDACHAALD